VTREEIRFRAVGLVGAGILRGLGRSLRFQLEGTEHLEGCRRERRPVILAFWHAWILPLAYLHRGEGIVVLTSEHGDGEYITRVIQRMGFRTARGSSTRGGARGLRDVVRAAREGRDIGITPDGPRGPARSFKRGGLVAAKLTGARIVPMAVFAEGVHRLDSWDRFVIPRPFARIRVRYGAPHAIPRNAGDEELDRHALALERHLNQFEPDASERGARKDSGRPGGTRP
jgi:lysophospholipid acyltransferase (LPLAT)-like uncharacterized protein